jgi:hypothetical protein
MAEHFERNTPGMHTSDTLDYGIFIRGKCFWNSTTEKPSTSVKAIALFKTELETDGGTRYPNLANGICRRST